MSVGLRESRRTAQVWGAFAWVSLALRPGIAKQTQMIRRHYSHANVMPWGGLCATQERGIARRVDKR